MTDTNNRYLVFKREAKMAICYIPPLSNIHKTYMMQSAFLMDGHLGCVYMFCFINRENSYWNLFTTVPWCSGQKTWFLVTDPSSSTFRKYLDLDHIPLSQHSSAFRCVAASLISCLLKCGHGIRALTPPHRAEIPQEVSLIPEVDWCWHLPSEMKTYYMNIGCAFHPSQYPTKNPCHS